MRQVGHAGEGRAALEVDEHHVELLGRVGHGQAEHEGAQELGLARAGRADHQAVRAHALLGGLLEVEVHQRGALAEPDRHPQPVAGGSRCAMPAGGRRSARRRAPSRSMKSVGPTISPVLGSTAPLPAVRSGVSRRASASAVAALHWSARARIGSSRSRSARTGGRPSLRTRSLPRRCVELDPQPGRVLEFVPARRQVEQGDAVEPVGGYDVVAGRQQTAVDHQQQVRGGGPLVGAEAGPLAQVAPGAAPRGRTGRWTPSASVRSRRTAGCSGRGAAT